MAFKYRPMTDKEVEVPDRVYLLEPDKAPLPKPKAPLLYGPDGRIITDHPRFRWIEDLVIPRGVK